MRTIRTANTLFLDRDGVINVRKMGGYIQSVEEFRFLDGVKEAFEIFSRLFDTIVVVTNQQGIGKGLMSEQDFADISAYMKSEIEKAGGKLDFVFHAPQLKSAHSIDRKPAIGMGLKARKRFRCLNFKDSIMVGDSVSDLVFGKRLKMHTVHLSPTPDAAREHYRRIDYRFDNLLDFAKFIEDEKNKQNS